MASRQILGVKNRDKREQVCVQEIVNHLLNENEAVGISASFFLFILPNNVLPRQV